VLSRARRKSTATIRIYLRLQYRAGRGDAASPIVSALGRRRMLRRFSGRPMVFFFYYIIPPWVRSCAIRPLPAILNPVQCDH